MTQHRASAQYHGQDQKTEMTACAVAVYAKVIQSLVMMAYLRSEGVFGAGWI